MLDDILGWKVKPRTAGNFATAANEEGAEQAVDRLLDKVPDAVEALIRKLKQRGLRKHWAWRSVLNRLSKPRTEKDIELGRELDDEAFDRERFSWHVGEYLRTLSQEAATESEIGQRARDSAWDKCRTVMEHDDTDVTWPKDWVMELLNSGPGKAVSGALSLLGYWTDGENGEGRDEAKAAEVLECLGRAIDRGRHTGLCAVAGCAERIAWLRHRHTAWTREAIIEPIEQKANNEARRALWDGLRYAAWQHVEVIRELRKVLRDVLNIPDGGEQEHRGQIAAEKYGYALLGSTYQEYDTYGDWRIGEAGKEIRALIVHEVTREVRQARKRVPGMWKRAIQPMWTDLLTSKTTGVERDEQRDLLACLSGLDAEEQKEAATLFVQGPCVPPEGMWGIADEGEVAVDPGLKILRHCAKPASEEGATVGWEWDTAQQKMQEWRRGGLTPRQRALWEEIWNMLGMKPPSS